MLARATRAKPDFPEAHYNLGTALYNRNQFKEAIAEFQQAVRVRQDYADAYNSLGTALYRDSQFEPAIDGVQENAGAEAWQMRRLTTISARFTSEPNVTRKLRRAFKEAVRIKPDYSEAHFNLALAYVALNDKKGALEQYNRLKKLDPKLAEEFFQKYMKK